MAGKKYDVIIIGAGPAGIFCALELVRKTRLTVLIIDKGSGLSKRKCPSPNGSCLHCIPCNTTSGWGGAGAFSDGKLTLSSEIGGWLPELTSKKTVEKLIEKVDKIYLEFGAPALTFGEDEELIQEIAREAVKSDMQLIPSRIRHMGTDLCPKVLDRMYGEINGGAEILMETEVEKIRVKNGKAVGVTINDGTRYNCKYLVAAPGRSGANWLDGVASETGLQLQKNMVDIGIRVEVPAVIMEPLTDDLYEPKLVYYSNSTDDRVRIFCMNPYGEVIKEYNEDVLTVNGHSYADERTENTNFALLIDKRFTDPFKEPIQYGKSIARLANLLGDGIIVQRLGDLLSGKRSTPARISRSTVDPTLRDATPGDLSLVMPYRYLSDILEMLKALDSMVPGVYSRNTLLYGVEVKFYSSRLKVSPALESEVTNLFGAGDGVGITRGLVQASASGLLTADTIIRREKGSTR
ncbi:MAG: FAD-dependent oxidoreductase [Actinobacteria bacterium]|nr:FAD-dependent oxidoreductase [Actinomycetota bacterium]